MIATIILAASLFHHKKPQQPVLPPTPTVVLGIDDTATIEAVSDAAFIANRAADEMPELGAYVTAVRKDIDRVNADDVVSDQYLADLKRLVNDVAELSAQMKNYRSLYFL